MKFPRKVYAIRHNKTDRVYIGSSSQVDKRLKNHLTALRANKHSVEDMQSDFNNFGEDYTFTILDTISNFQEREKEYEWMRKYQSHKRGLGYNYKDQKWDFSPRKKVVDYASDISQMIKGSKDPGRALIIAATLLGQFATQNKVEIEYR